MFILNNGGRMENKVLIDTVCLSNYYYECKIVEQYIYGYFLHFMHDYCNSKTNPS